MWRPVNLRVIGLMVGLFVGLIAALAAVLLIRFARMPVAVAQGVVAGLAVDVAVAVITTPHSTHMDLAVASAAAGRHVYLEKPMVQKSKTGWSMDSKRKSLPSILRSMAKRPIQSLNP